MEDIVISALLDLHELTAHVMKGMANRLDLLSWGILVILIWLFAITVYLWIIRKKA